MTYFGSADKDKLNNSPGVIRILRTYTGWKTCYNDPFCILYSCLLLIIDLIMFDKKLTKNLLDKN